MTTTTDTKDDREPVAIQAERLQELLEYERLFKAAQNAVSFVETPKQFRDPAAAIRWLHTRYMLELQSTRSRQRGAAIVELQNLVDRLPQLVHEQDGDSVPVPALLSYVEARSKDIHR